MLTVVTHSKIAGQDQIEMAYCGWNCTHDFIVVVIIMAVIEWSTMMVFVSQLSRTKSPHANACN